MGHIIGEVPFKKNDVSIGTEHTVLDSIRGIKENYFTL